MRLVISRPRRRGERRWGGDASASRGSGSVGRRGRCRSITPTGPPGGGGSHVPSESPTLYSHWQADVGVKQAAGPGVGHTTAKTSRLQPAPLIGGDDRPSSPRQDGILTLKSFMIPHVIGRLTAQVDWL